MNHEIQSVYQSPYCAEIIGLGSHVPENIVTNDDLSKLMETNDEWIQKRTGIQERRWVDKGESTSDLALIAAQKALKDANLEAKDLDMIIFSTLSPDHDFPGAGCFLQAKLDVPGIPAIDLRQQCTGFLYGLTVAQQFIENGMYKNVLLVGAEVHSKGLDKTTRGRDVSVLFGDGAGAVVLTRSNRQKDSSKQSKLFQSILHADGRYAKELWLPAPGMGLYPNDRLTHQTLEDGLHFPSMNGKKVFVHAIEGMCTSLMNCLKQNSVKLEEVELFVFHQANLRINQMVAQQLNIPEDKIFNTIQKLGNTTAATIPLTLDHAREAGKLKKGTLVASAAFGSGFTWGATLYRF